jgi:hypothetical protein
MPSSVFVRGDRPLDRTELEDLLAIMESREHPPDRAHWLMHPEAGDPWLSVFTHEHAGELSKVKLSVSFTSPLFPRNLADMFDLALRLARQLEARVYEEQGNREVTVENIDSLLDPDSEYASGLISLWQSGRKRLLSENQAPFELPLGAIDSASDYFAFQFPTGQAPPPLAELVLGTPAHLTPHVLEHSAVLEHTARGEGAVRILRLGDAVWVRPYWSELTFAELAAEVLPAVDRAGARLGVAPRLLGQPIDAARREAIAAHAGGLGVEFFEWLVHGIEPAR